MCSDSSGVGVEDLSALTDQQVLDRTRALVKSMNRVAAELARTVRAAENKQAFRHDGMTSTRSWLRGHCRLSGSAASQVVRNGRVLEQLPAVAAAHAAGSITADQVDVIAKVTAPRIAALIEAQGGTVAGVGEVLAPFAACQRHDDLTRVVHQLLERLDQDGPEPDPTEERFLSFAQHTDGSITGRFHLDA